MCYSQVARWRRSADHRSTVTTASAVFSGTTTERPHEFFDYTTGYIFTFGIGTPLLERNVLREFDRILKKAGLAKRRIHDLRHTCISLLHAQGVPLKTISDIVGHTDMRLTSFRYLHIFTEEKKQAARTMDRLLR